MSDTPSEATTQYLSRLERALRRVPPDDRAAIVKEISSHIAERSASADANVDRILKDLGEPDDLAKAYVEQYALTDALQRSTPGPLLLAILDRATRSFAAFFIGLGAVALYVSALSFIIVAIMKPIWPQSVGMWWGEKTFSVGFLSAVPEHTSEVLGYWIIPVVLVAAVLCYVAGTALMKWGGRILLRKTTLSPKS